MTIATLPLVRAATPVAGAARAAAAIAGYELRNAVRSRWLVGYAAFFVIATDILLRFDGDAGRALLSLGSIALFVVPLVALVFGTTYLYASREFNELLLAQPVGRGALFAGLYAGLALPLVGALAAGIALPFAWHGMPSAADMVTLAVIGGIGAALTLAFVGLAFMIAIRSLDRVRGLAIAIGAWLLMALLYDALVLVVVALFSDYPIERPLVGLMLANPVDLGRMLLLQRLDAGALQGYTGAVFSRFFGGSGTILAASILAAWAVIPAAFARRAFVRADF
jgi:Cu-processing system permease protein